MGRGDWVGTQASPGFKIGQTGAVELSVSEVLRDGAIEAVADLKADGLEPRIYSGDTQSANNAVAEQLGGIPATGDMHPQQKHDAIAALSHQGKRVLMVGDGLNDTAALAAAHASISPVSALDASRAASDIVLLGQSLGDIPKAIKTARSARRRVLENFGIAAGYNMIAIPIAVLGYASPLSAAIAMSASSITVLINALRLR